MINKKLKYFVFICLTLSFVLSPAITYSVEKQFVESNAILNSSNKHKSPNTQQTTLAKTDIHDRKAILNDDSRGLSGFFILGIIINIIMIITFSWWFSKEWRRSKK